MKGFLFFILLSFSYSSFASPLLKELLQQQKKLHEQIRSECGLEIISAGDRRLPRTRIKADYVIAKMSSETSFEIAGYLSTHLEPTQLSFRYRKTNGGLMGAMFFTGENQLIYSLARGGNIATHRVTRRTSGPRHYYRCGRTSRHDEASYNRCLNERFILSLSSRLCDQLI